ncbi:hypothetical protein [Tenacibaculum aiptasiae]|uniref:hypothetical protein n=1 Tax=Tenacibaculum aiptasiae TaxID=426481 RepID=UPI00232CD9CE|nr:hypothetical protein [Tenacibaculum aiptasiae]
MKAKIKIAAIVMIAMSFGAKAQNSYPKTGTVSFYDITSTQTIPKLSLGRHAGEAFNFYVSDYVGTIKFKQDEPNSMHEMRFDIESPTINEMNYAFMFNGVSKFRIKSNGNLGIGTSQPKSKLDFGNNHSDPSVFPNKITLWSGEENNYFGFGISSSDLDYFSQGNHRFYTEYNGTPGSEKMVIQSNGNVGIGTTSPQDLLNLHNPDQTSNIGLKITRGNENHGLRLGVNNTHAFLWTTENQNLVLATSDKERLTVTSGGNVGIGTTSPQDLLNLHNSDQTSNIGLKITRGNENHGLRLGVNNSYAFLWTTENQNLVLATSDKERLTVTSGGYVGIGNSSPSTKLDVGGELKTNWGRLVLRDNSLEEWYTNGPARLAVNYLGYQKGDSQFRDYTIYNGKRVGILHVSGEQESVGIGTENTFGYKLAVNGKIGAKEVKVEVNSPWPDFVFEKNYNLPTLKEVENHIKEKGHLKNIPNAKEVEKNGFFLGEMDSKLLQKIEELTLYTIEQEKKLNAQKEEIENLKTQNSKIDEQQKKIERLEMLVNKLLKDKK